MRISALTVFSFVSFTLSQETSSNGTCYYPDGSLAVNMYGGKTFSPCTSTGTSQCCGTNDVCISNGLCFDAWQGELYRGACTDRSWSGALCPAYCTAGSPDAWVNIVPCPYSAENQWSWWCGTNSITDQCNASVISPNVSFVPYTHGSNLNIIQNNSTVTVSNLTNTTVPSNNATGQNATVQAQGQSLYTTSQMRAAEAKVGLGVGIPLGILSAVLALLLALEKKKTHQRIVGSPVEKGKGADGLPPTYELGQGTHTFELPSG